MWKVLLACKVLVVKILIWIDNALYKVWAHVTKVKNKHYLNAFLLDVSFHS
jgi:hypothetical protein